jgi:hypothetical protein
MVAGNDDDNTNIVTRHLSRLDVLAEIASQQPYLPLSEFPAPNLLLLAKVAVMMLRKETETNNENPDVGNETTANNAITPSNKTAAERMSDIDDDSAEEVIEVRPLKRAKPAASPVANRSPARTRKPSAKCCLGIQAKRSKKSAASATSSRAVPGLPPVFELPFPALYKRRSGGE